METRFLIRSPRALALCQTPPGLTPLSPSPSPPPSGSVVETALYKCVLKPLRDCIYGQLLEFHSRDGSLQKLRDHQLTMGRQSLAELGVTANVPDAPALERIQAKLVQMHQAYSPKKKEAQLLKACKLIYEAMNHGTGGKGRGGWLGGGEAGAARGCQGNLHPGPGEPPLPHGTPLSCLPAPKDGVLHPP